MTIKFFGFKVTVQKEEKIETLKVNINETARKNAVNEIDLAGIKAKLQALKNDD